MAPAADVLVLAVGSVACDWSPPSGFATGDARGCCAASAGLLRVRNGEPVPVQLQLRQPCQRRVHATPDSHVELPGACGPAAELDPLLQLFLDGSAPDGLLLSASPRLSEDSLVLMLSDQWFDLPAQRRETLAQSWFERAAALGDACLQLVDGHDQLLARCARVGSGMILFDREPVA